MRLCERTTCICHSCARSHWCPRVTKWTGTRMFVVHSLGTFRHFQNFPRNSLFSGKIRQETCGCHRRACMSNLSRVRPQFLVEMVPRASKNCVMMNSNWTNVRTYVHICSAFVPNILWHSFIYRLPGKRWWTANKHDWTHSFKFAATLHLANAHVRLSLVTHSLSVYTT